MKQKIKPALILFMMACAGYAELPSAWIPQPWLDAGRYQGAHEINQAVMRYEELGVTIWTLTLDHWTDAAGEIDLRRYPNPRTWLLDLEERGIYAIAEPPLFADLNPSLPAQVRPAPPQPSTWDGLRNAFDEMLAASDLLIQPIGGTGRPEKNLFLRWLQLATFSPLFTLGTEPWQYDQETLDIFRRHARLRQRLLAAWGQVPPAPVPVPNSFNQYYLGPDLMVAPILSTNSLRTIYIPEGRWVDLQTGAEIEGQRIYDREVALDEIPVYAAADSYEIYRNLFREPEEVPVPTVAVEPLEHQARVYWTEGQTPFSFRYRLTNQSDEPVFVGARLGVPAGVAVEPNQIIRFGLDVGESREIFFEVSVPGGLAPGSYPMPLEIRAAGEDLPAPEQWLIISPQWRILGPFEGGVGTDPSGDGLLPDLNSAFTSREGQVLRWRDVPAATLTSEGYWDFTSLTGPQPYTTSYLYTEIESLRPRRARIWIGSGDAVTVWLNGQEIYEYPYHRNPVRDGEAIEALLLGGKNEIILRMNRDLAPNQLFFRFE